MSGEKDIFEGAEDRDTDRDGPMIAAEYSLGLLEGEELLAARGRMASDPDFAWRREWWDNWFVPLSDEVAGAEPGGEVWSRIEREVTARRTAQAEAKLVGDMAGNREGHGADGGGNAANVVELRSQLRRWQWAAALTSAAAAVALALFFTAPGPGSAPAPDNAPTLAASDAPLMASIPIRETPLRLGVTFLPGSDEMLVSAAGLTADGVHDHELWLVPADGGALQSLGVIAPGEERRMRLPEEVARNMEPGVELVLTREPLGGKPEGVDAGPVVAQGAFGAV
ncbi:MAG: anti-sigma factor [Erythrobacter sp.]|jgi:anti-sigma-K factor RskA|nr:anti-sigma factor [Erythrobacter sp.]